MAAPGKMSRLAQAAEPGIRTLGGGIREAARRSVGGVASGPGATEIEKMEGRLLAEAEREQNKPPEPEEPKDEAV